MPGKGVGCVATSCLMPGHLLLRETPCLLLQPGQGARSCLLAFQNMSKCHQEQYLKLGNMFTKEESDWSTTAANDMAAMRSELAAAPVTGLTMNDARTIWQIKLTNSFHNGVCLRMSRFNHSCCPNAEYFWNPDTETRDVRVVRKVEQEQEVCLDYR